MSPSFSASGTHAAAAARAPGGAFKVVVGFVALLLIALTLPAAHSQSLDAELKEVPIDELKRVYLSCDRAADSGQLNTGGIMYCSMVYEELKRRAFGGDFARLLAWSRAQPSARNTGR